MTQKRTLKQTILTFNPDDLIAVGSASVFFWFGKAVQLEKAAPKINDEMRTAGQYLVDRSKVEIIGRKKAVAEAVTPTDEEIAKSALENAEKLLAKRLKYMDTFKPILSRKVNSVTESITDGGYRVVITGTENGRYWNLKEWRKEHENQLHAV